MHPAPQSIRAKAGAEKPEQKVTAILTVTHSPWLPPLGSSKDTGEAEREATRAEDHRCYKDGEATEVGLPSSICSNMKAKETDGSIRERGHQADRTQDPHYILRKQLPPEESGAWRGRTKPLPAPTLHLHQFRRHLVQPNTFCDQ